MEYINKTIKKDLQTLSKPGKKSLSSDEDDLSLEKLLQDKSKHGVFEADFENQNGTTVTVRDGDSVVLGCRVYLLHDKTVSTLHILQFFQGLPLSLYTSLFIRTYLRYICVQSIKFCVVMRVG